MQDYREFIDEVLVSEASIQKRVRELGEQISRMHSIGMDDLGGGDAFFDGDTDDTLVTAPEFVRLGVAAGLRESALRDGLRFYEAAMAAGPPLERRLTHNDLRACHTPA